MFDSYIAVPLHFTIEFLGFLVAAGGALMAFTRPSLVPGEVSNRITVGLGFLSLAAAQVLHGGAFIEADGSELLIGLRALGYAFILVGIVGGIRVGAAATASAAYRVEQPLLFAPAGAAFVLAIAALWGSLTAGPRTLRRLAIAAFLLSGFEVMTAAKGAAEADFGAKAVPVYAYIGHAAKAVGFLMIAAWVWTAVRSSIRTRFVASFAALLVGVVLALSSSLTGVLSNSIEKEALERVGRQLDSSQAELEDAERLDLANNVKFMTKLEKSIQGPMARGEDLNLVAQSLRDPDESVFDLDFLMFTDAKGTVLGFDGVESIQGVDIVRINGSEVIEEVISDRSDSSASPIDIGPKTLAVMAAQRVPDPLDPRRTAGVVAAGRLINRLDILKMADRLDVEVTLIGDGGRVIATTLPKDTVDLKIVPRRLRTLIETSPTPVTERQVLGEDAYFSAFAPIDTPTGETVATLVFSSPAASIVTTRQSLIRILFLVAMAVGVAALGLAWFSGRRITRPIQLLTDTAQAVREGDLQAQAPIGGDDEVGRLGETFNDMTTSLFKMTNDLREAAREEHRLRARIETIIQSMADGLVATDAQHMIVAFNREAEALTGLKARHALGKPLSTVLDARDSHGDSVLLPIFDLAEGFVDNIYLARKNGDRVPVAAVSAVLRDDEGEVTGGVAVLRDMTREREVERMKSEFLANISHELRTPLTPIKGYAEILGRKELPREKTVKFVSGILESTGRLERIVELLVDFSAMEAGRLAPRAKPVDISEMLEQLAVEWRKRAPSHTFEVEVPGKLSLVAGDERLLRRSLQEVLDNAVKFSPHGGRITLAGKGSSSSEGERRQRSVKVSIADEGIGISPKDISKVFTDFHQLDGSETRSYGGLGLGLAFVQRIVEAHGGRVTVESAIDRGTTLTITLPAARSERKPEEPAAASPSDRDEPGPVIPPKAEPEETAPLAGESEGGSEPGSAA
jgi:two-component system sensor histidine kinase VicK